jgi:hypothetical protein
MYFTLLVGFYHHEADKFVYEHLESDDCFRYENLINHYPSKLQDVCKVVINTQHGNFSALLTQFLCEFPYKEILKKLTFIDSTKPDERHNIYTIRQNLTKLDESVAQRYASNNYGLSYLLYQIEPY